MRVLRFSAKLKVLITFTVFGLSTGCAGIGGAMLGSAVQGAFMGSAFPINRGPKPAKVDCAAEDSMALTYGTQGSSEARDQAMQLISENCKHGHVETHRAYYTITTKVYVACLRADGTTPESLSCKYVAAEKTPRGFANCDPAVEEC